MTASPALVHEQYTYNDGDVPYSDETRPLLSDPEGARDRHPQATPLPVRQLATLCAIRLADPVAFTQIFPYVNEMMEKFGVAEPSKTGFYSGLVVCLPSLIYASSIINVFDNSGKRLRTCSTHVHLPLGKPF